MAEGNNGEIGNGKGRDMAEGDNREIGNGQVMLNGNGKGNGRDGIETSNNKPITFSSKGKDLCISAKSPT